MFSIHGWYFYFTKLNVICKIYRSKILYVVYAQYFIQALFLFYVFASASVLFSFTIKNALCLKT